MADQQSFAPVFSRLKQILKPYAKRLVVTHDTPTEFYLDTKRIMPNKKPLFFGAVRVNKSYVSYHLMAVYAFPDLLQTISPGLKKRMQGKSCFNFRAINETEMRELARLTKAGAARFKKGGLPTSTASKSKKRKSSAHGVA